MKRNQFEEKKSKSKEREEADEERRRWNAREVYGSAGTTH